MALESEGGQATSDTDSWAADLLAGLEGDSSAGDSVHNNSPTGDLHALNSARLQEFCGLEMIPIIQVEYAYAKGRRKPAVCLQVVRRKVLPMEI